MFVVRNSCTKILPQRGKTKILVGGDSQREKEEREEKVALKITGRGTFFLKLMLLSKFIEFAMF